MDDDLRAGERAWRADPDDPLALERWIEARYRAGLPVGHELLERRRCAPRELRLPIACAVSARQPDGEVIGLEPPRRGAPLQAPEHSLLWFAPREDRYVDPPVELLDAVRRLGGLTGEGGAGEGATGLNLVLPADLTALASALEQGPWTHLDLHDLPAACEAFLAALAGLPRLASLELTGGNLVGLGAAGLRPLAAARALTRLSIRRTFLEPSALPAPCGRLLQELTLSEPRAEQEPAEVDGELEAIARAAPGLVRLDLSESNRACTDYGLRALGAWARELTHLELATRDADQITDAGVRELISLPLRTLALPGAQLTDASAAALASLSLTHLHVRDPRFSPGALGLLPLEATRLSPTLIDPAPLGFLERVGDRLYGLSLTALGGPNPPPPDLSPLRRASGLRELDLFVHGPQPHDPLLYLDGCVRLEELTLLGLPELSPRAAAILVALPLRKLTVFLSGSEPRSARAEARAFARLATHPTLESLTISSQAGDDEVYLALGSAPRLRRLSILGQGGPSSFALQRLVSQRPGLRVSLRGTLIRPGPAAPPPGD